MKLPPPILERVAAGEVDLAFRRWIRPTVAAGATLRTALGPLRVLTVERVEEHGITEAEAQRAGHGSRAELLEELASGRPGWVYRIELAVERADPARGRER